MSTHKVIKTALDPLSHEKPKLLMIGKSQLSNRELYFALLLTQHVLYITKHTVRRRLHQYGFIICRWATKRVNWKLPHSSKTPLGTAS